MNRDTTVDGADLIAWQGTYGAPYNQMANADLDGDFDTDGRDFLLLQRGFGNSGAAGSFQPTTMARYVPAFDIVSVPEPTGLTLLTTAIAGLYFVRRSSRQA